MPRSSSALGAACRADPVLTIALLALAATAAPAQVAIVRVDLDERGQTMRGWEAVASDSGASAPGLLPALVERAANELGIDRLRVEVSGPAGLEALDETVVGIVLPLARALRNRGESLHVNVAYVPPAGADELADPEAYAAFVVAVHERLRDRHGLVPDTWEALVEPDRTGSRWDPARLAAGIAAAGRRLAAAGFEPRIVAPSTRTPAAALPYVEAIAREPAARAVLAEVSYRLYGEPADRERDRGALAAKARELGLPLAMLERPGLDPRTLVPEIRGGASVASQSRLAGPPADDGDHHFLLDPTAAGGPTVALGWRSRRLAPFFLAARRGAVRIGARSDDPRVAPVAFQAPGGGVAVVLVIEGGAPPAFAIEGLPAGRYEARFVRDAFEGSLPPAAIESGQVLRFPNPGPGVLAIRPTALPPAPLSGFEEPVPGANLLADPGFDEGGTRWDAVGAGRRAFADSSQRRSGSGALELNVQRLAGDRLGASQVVAARPGGVYRFRGWVKTWNLDGEGATVSLEWLARDDAAPPAGWRVLERTVVARMQREVHWTELGPAERTAPAGATAVRLEVSVAGEPDDRGFVWFDDLELCPRD